ncbi:MAG: LEPR-XLL domain-containing protein, partial [Terrimicrobiaceae bacterium]
MLRESIFPVQRSVRFQPLERRLLFSATPAGAVDPPNDPAVSQDSPAIDQVDSPESVDQPSQAEPAPQAAGAGSSGGESAAA